MKNTIILAVVAFLYCITNVYAHNPYGHVCFTAMLGKGLYPKGVTIDSVTCSNPKVRCSKVTKKGWNVYQWSCDIDQQKPGPAEPMLELHTTPKGKWYPTITLQKCGPGFRKPIKCIATVDAGTGYEADITPANTLANSFTIKFRRATKTKK